MYKTPTPHTHTPLFKPHLPPPLYFSFTPSQLCSLTHSEPGQTSTHRNSRPQINPGSRGSVPPAQHASSLESWSWFIRPFIACPSMDYLICYLHTKVTTFLKSAPPFCCKTMNDCGFIIKMSDTFFTFMLLNEWTDLLLCSCWSEWLPVMLEVFMMCGLLRRLSLVTLLKLNLPLLAANQTGLTVSWDTEKERENRHFVLILPPSALTHAHTGRILTHILSFQQGCYCVCIVFCTGSSCSLQLGGQHSPSLEEFNIFFMKSSQWIHNI